MNQDQRSAPSASHSVYVAMIRRGGWREGGTNNRSQLCKSQLQLRDVLKKGKKERKEDRREDEVRSLIQFVDEGRIRKVMRGEKSKITWSTMQSNYTNRLSIIDSNTYVHIYTRIHIYIYTPLCVHLGSVSTHSSWKLPVTLRYLSVKNHPRSPKSRKHIPPFLSSPPPFAYESELGVRDGRGGWPPLRGMIGGGRRGGERERYIWRNRYTCLVYANYKLASRAKFFIFRITGQFWDCWKVSLSLSFISNFSFSLYLFLFFFLWRERETSLERETIAARDTSAEKDFPVIIYYSCNLETVGINALLLCTTVLAGVRVPSDVRLSRNNFLYDEWTSCARNLRGWLIVVKVRMIHCCEILFVQLDTVVVLFVELRGLTRGIFKSGSLVFRVELLAQVYVTCTECFRFGKVIRVVEN